MNLVDHTKFEKMILAKRVGQFLAKPHAEEERSAVENVARILAQDVSAHVREVLAFELRHCKRLPADLAERIAFDIENVAVPFLATTMAFEDKDLARLVPSLEEYARVTLARRTDLGEQTSVALAEEGKEKSVTFLVRNDALDLNEQTYEGVLKRFEDNQRLMDQLSARADIPITIVERIIDNVSDHCRKTLVEHYAVDGSVAERLSENTRFESLWTQIENASHQQVHGYVTDLHAEDRLTHLLVMEMADRGNMYFLESSLAVRSGRTLARIRQILALENPEEFVGLMEEVDASSTMAPRYLKLAKKHYGSNNS